jgi:hypothetical protein
MRWVYGWGTVLQSEELATRKSMKALIVGGPDGIDNVAD